MRRLIAIAALCMLAACASEPSDETELSEVAFSDLPGWSYDHHAEAFAVFAQSCQANLRRGNAFTSKLGEYVGEVDAWRNVCGMTQRYSQITDVEARAFFEAHFAPYRVETEREPLGQLTGYYLPLLHGAPLPDGKYRYPVYGVPDGFVKGMQLPDRAAIEAGALNGNAPILLYVDDPVMLFFAHIQGSAKVQMPDGLIVTLQYAAQNGQSYVAIGRPMKEAGLLDQVSMQTIRDYLWEHPAEAPGIMNANPSYIFFSVNDKDPSAKGALGLSLTPLRSIAIDDDRAAYGVPTYISTTHPNYFTQQAEPLNRLFISQDTGGALHGPHRADIFFGIGDEAEWAAGHQNTRGNVFWLLPK